MLRAIAGVIYDGQVHPSEPLDEKVIARCVIVIMDESLGDLQVQAQEMLAPEKQTRLSELLSFNKAGNITQEQEQELDELLAQAYELAARKARAGRLLRQINGS